MNFGAIIGVVLSLIGKRDEIVKLVQDILRIVEQIKGLAPALAPAIEQITDVAQSASTTEYSIEWLQESLNELVGADLDVDGDYGEATKEAVKKFQKQYGLEVDGWAGIETQAAIVDALQ